MTQIDDLDYISLIIFEKEKRQKDYNENELQIQLELPINDEVFINKKDDTLVNNSNNCIIINL